MRLAANVGMWRIPRKTILFSSLIVSVATASSCVLFLTLIDLGSHSLYVVNQVLLLVIV